MSRARLPQAPLTLVLVLASLLVGTTLALSAPRRPSQVYSVAAARYALMHAPEHWLGRTFYVRGRLDGCPLAPAPCPVWQPRLFDPRQTTGRGALPVERLASTSWLRTLRRLPMLGALLPVPRIARWRVVATFPVQVQAQPLTPCLWYRCAVSSDYSAFACTTRACYHALVFADVP
jgi:hypothetical protein